MFQQVLEPRAARVAEQGSGPVLEVTRAGQGRLAGLARSLPLVLAPIAIGYACTLRALHEFAYGSPIYGPGGQPWAYGEWVISYAAGFVRRGLSGEILIPLIHLTGSPALPYLAVNILLASLTAAALLVRYARHGRTEAVLMLLLPTSVLFPLWDYNVVGRKEQLVLALAAVIALAARRSVPAASPSGSLVLGLALAALIPLHEGLVFFVPLLFALLELLREPESPGAVLARFARIVLPSVAAFVIVLAASGPVDTAALYAAVPDYGPGMEAWCKARGIGSICWLGLPTSFAVGYVYRIGFDGFMQALALVLLQSALVTATYLRVRGRPVDGRTVALLAVGWIGVAPLYLVAFDWGRWHATIAILFALLAPLGRARPRGTTTLLAAAVLLSLFTVGHMQSQAFEVGGPRLAKWLLDEAAAFFAIRPA